MNIINNKEISGAIGLSILKKNDMELLIFYDQHNNENYCNSNYSNFIDKVFENIMNKDEVLILLEELLYYGKDNQIVTLWKETKHTVDFKNFFLKYRYKKNVLPFDIRTLLFPCNIYIIRQVIDTDDKNIPDDISLNRLNEFIDNATVREYFYIIFYLFNLTEKNDEYHQKYKNSIKYIKDLKKDIINCFKNIYMRDNKLGDIVTLHYKKIKIKAKELKTKYCDKNMNNLLKDFILSLKKDKYVLEKYIYKDFLNDSIKDYSVFDYINLISDSLMEFYGILLILCNNKKTNFLHSGLAHSSNIVWLFKKLYGFNLIKNKGLTENNLDKMQNIFNIPNVKNCLKIN
jgi:hypothetical protein